jgi:mannan endo-1,4-beta-mannosidase
MKRTMVLLAALIVAVLSSSCASTPVLEPQDYALRNLKSGRFLTVARHSENTNGGLVYVWDWEETEAQVWRVAYLGGGYYKLTVRASAKVLDAHSDDVRQNGCKVQIWDLNGWDNQKWRIRQLENGNYRISVKPSGKCLALTEYDTDNGATVHLWTCKKGDETQEWELKPVARP